ncbi:MAG: hypothetical protein HQ569_00165 [Actinobacteria bacterium]|nr:hypothetical protein [Actinomycetota bacterium]
MTYILGLDGGATKTTAVALEIETGKREECLSGPSNYLSSGIKVTSKNIRNAILNLVEKIQNNCGLSHVNFASACFGLAGYDSYEDLEHYKKIVFSSDLQKFFNRKKTIFCNDTRICLRACTKNKNAIILICGTGSHCYGINSDGDESESNGWDFILGDEGSGYSIGAKALRAVARFYDGRGEPTILLEKILKDLNIENIYKLTRWVYLPFSKEKVALIAKIVEEAALAGDKKSIKIIREEAFEAIESVKAVVRKLKLSEEIFDCVLSGSIFKDESFFKPIVISNLKKTYKKIKIKYLDKNPVEGALELALDKFKF